ncbi:hypothetical protein Tco_1392408 [Tanacetum coccineum]
MQYSKRQGRFFKGWSWLWLDSKAASGGAFKIQFIQKVSHLHAVKRIFSLDRKSTTRGCQFLGSGLISWQCKKHTVVANSTPEVINAARHNLLLLLKVNVARHNLLLLLKVNAARHNLLLLLKVNAARHKLTAAVES